MLTVSSYDIKELYITYVYIYVQGKWPNIIARIVHVTSRHKLENGRNVSNWAIIEVTISRPETIEVTSIIARLLTSRLFADLSLRAIVLREWYLEWGMRRAEAIYWRRRLKSQGGANNRLGRRWCGAIMSRAIMWSTTAVVPNFTSGDFIMSQQLWSPQYHVANLKLSFYWIKIL